MYFLHLNRSLLELLFGTISWSLPPLTVDLCGFRLDFERPVSLVTKFKLPSGRRLTLA